eukprot:6455814-Prymnesium_polylepis.1
MTRLQGYRDTLCELEDRVAGGGADNQMTACVGCCDRTADRSDARELFACCPSGQNGRPKRS